jgi:endonuclease/exonuclease/phosphatase family metal-dependent hydrolase
MALFGVRRSAKTAARALRALAWSATHPPAAVEAAEFQGAGPPVPQRPLRVLTWNIQFAAGRDQRFFYDGGRDVHVDPAALRPTLDRIAAVIRASDADLVLLQEVDRGSDRTGRLDQHQALLDRLSYPCHASTWYYRNPYVPYPSWQHLGRMEMHLSVFSRFGISAARRWRLAEMREAWVYRQFNLRRAVLELDLPRAEGGVLRVFDVHLSAFSKGDGTLPLQIDAVAERMALADRQSTPFVTGGDFNALPPGDPPARLGADAALYSDGGWPIDPLFRTWTSAVPLERHQDEPQPWRTWLPPGSEEADRAIDHLFVSSDLEVHDAAVLRGDPGASDHLPLLVEVGWKA